MRFLSLTGQVRFDVSRFSNREQGIGSKSVTNIGTSSAVISTTERTGREVGRGISRIRRKSGCKVEGWESA